MIEKNANIISLGRKSKSKSPAARRAKALGHGEDVLITKHSQDGYDRAVSNSYHNTTRTYNDFAEPNTGFPPRLSTETNENVQIPLHSKTQGAFMRPPCRRKNGAPIVLQRTPSRDKHAQIQGPPLQVIVKTLAPVEAKEVQIRNQSPYKSTQPILSQTLVQQLQSVTQPIQSTKLLQSPLPVQPTSQITQQVPASVQIAQPVDSQVFRKIRFLQNRVADLHRQKQAVTMSSNEQIVKLQHENQQLKQKLKEAGETSLQTHHDTQVEEMLSEEIRNSLALREKLDSLNAAHQELTFRYEALKAETNKEENLFNQKIIYSEALTQTEADNEVSHIVSRNDTGSNRENELENELAELKETMTSNANEIATIHSNNCKIIEQYEATVTRLKLEIKKITEAQNKQEEGIQEIMREKQKRILELEESNFLLASEAKMKSDNAIESQSAIAEQNAALASKQISLMKQLLSTINQQKSQLLAELTTMRDREQAASIEMQLIKEQLAQNQQKQLQSGKEECGKCKQFLKTIFKLNNQLNTKK